MPAESQEPEDDLDFQDTSRPDPRQVYSGPSHGTLVIDGKSISADILRAELIQSVDTHHELKIVLSEVGMTSQDDDFADVSKYTDFLGKTLSFTIEVEIPDRPGPEKMTFNGVVARIDIENGVTALNVVTVVGVSPTVHMDGAKKNAFYREMSASDIIGSIVGKYQITRGQADSSKGTLKFSVQYRETDYEYIMRLATGAGMFAYYDGQEFRVTKANSSDAEELSWRGELGSFTLGLGTAPCEFSTQVYNYEQKKTFTQDTKSLTQQAALSDMSKISPEASKKLYGDAGFSTSATVIDDAQSLDQVLQRDRSRAMGKMVVGRGQSIVPNVVSGHGIKVEGLAKMDGTYWVTKVKHILDVNGYYNLFECVPLDLAFPQYKSARQTITSLQSATVVDNVDPDKLGRIKVQFPWNDTDATPWVRLVTPHAGPERGWVSLPEIGDEVLVGYEQGSPDLPVVLGALYNKENMPHGDCGDDTNSVKMFMTRGGHQIYMSDADGKEELRIVNKDQKNEIVMELSGPSITIQSEGDITLKGNNITVEAQGTIKMEGNAIEQKGKGDVKVEAGMNMTAKASMQHQIEGMTVTVKGNPIQLN